MFCLSRGAGGSGQRIVRKPSKKPGGRALEDAVRPYRQEFGDRLSGLLDQFDSRTEAAAVAGVVPDQLARYARGTVKPTLEVIARLARAKGVSLDWLWTGEGARDIGGEEPDVAGSLVSIPLYDVRVGAGLGQFAEEEAPIARVSFDRAWLAAHGIKPSGAKLMLAKGDSMSDTIEDGDPILVDTADIEPRDKVYVVRRGGALLVKRLQRHSDGAISLLSDNPAYGPERLPRDEADNLEIIGRVGMVFKAV